MNTELLAQNNLTWTLQDDLYSVSYKSTGKLIADNLSSIEWEVFVTAFEVGHNIAVLKPPRIIREDPLESITEDVDIAIEDKEEELAELKRLRGKIEEFDDKLSCFRQELEDIV